MSPHHEAVLIGPAAEPLASLLQELEPNVHVRRFSDLYAAVTELAATPPQTLWLDGDRLVAEDVGALRLLRRTLPECRTVVIRGARTASAVLDPALALGCHAIPAPPTTRDVAIVLQTRRATRRQHPTHELLAGLADQLNNPLAALAGRLQLLRLAVDSGDPSDLADNLQLAMQSAGRMQEAIEKLGMLAGRGRPVLGPVALLGLLRELAVDLGRRVTPPAGSDDVIVLADAELLAQALKSTIVVALDLAGRGRVALALSARGQGGSVAMVRLENPVPQPCRVEEIAQPFRLSRMLRNPDLGLDLAVASTLLEAQGGGLSAQVETGFLAAFEIVLRVAERGAR